MPKPGPNGGLGWCTCLAVLLHPAGHELDDGKQCWHTLSLNSPDLGEAQ